MATLTHLLIAAIVGIMLFFTAAIAPMIFKILPAESASRFVRAFFPRYYFCLLVSSATATITAVSSFEKFSLGIISLLFLINFIWLTPAINHASDHQLKRRFAWLHGLSVVINLGQLITCFALLFSISA